MFGRRLILQSPSKVFRSSGPGSNFKVDFGNGATERSIDSYILLNTLLIHEILDSQLFFRTVLLTHLNLSLINLKMQNLFSDTWFPILQSMLNLELTSLNARLSTPYFAHRRGTVS